MLFKIFISRFRITTVKNYERIFIYDYILADTAKIIQKVLSLKKEKQYLLSRVFLTPGVRIMHE